MRLKDFDIDIMPIRDDSQHRAALEYIEKFWDAKPGTAQFDLLDLLTTLVETYEAKRWPSEALDPIDAIKAAMEAEGHTRGELATLIGQNRATEVLGRHRALTLPMIRAISHAWHVPAEVLVKEYALAK